MFNNVFEGHLFRPPGQVEATLGASSRIQHVTARQNVQNLGEVVPRDVQGSRNIVNSHGLSVCLLREIQRRLERVDGSL